MNILIVDDNPANLLLLAKLSEQIDGVRVISYQNPEEALAWCAGHRPDLVLLDYMMPGMNGIEFLDRFRAQDDVSGVPVIMITASTELALQQQALDATATEFLCKPVQKSAFQARIRNLLKLRDSQLRFAEQAKQLSDEVDSAIQRALDQEREMVLRISGMAGFRDPETGAHLQRMAAYSRLIARNLGLSEETQAVIFKAAPMHDLGKIGIPDEILLKPGRLTPDEYEIMKRHTLIGYEMLKNSQSALLQAGADIALSHHEHYDGGGYPHGLAGEQIPFYGRIVAVADVFDALTSERQYKPAWAMERVITFMRERSGSQFDPQVLEAFLQDREQVMAIKDAATAG